MLGLGKNTGIIVVLLNFIYSFYNSGTAIKLLLMPTHILSDTMIAPHRLLSRQV